MTAPIDLTPTDGDGEIVIVKVIDPDGRPIPTATLRNREERVAHRVNARTGRWIGEGLFLPDRVQRFFPGYALELDVRAPGYVPVRVSYEVWADRNRVEVVLHPFGGTVRGRHGAVVIPDWEAIAADLAWVAPAREPLLTPAFVSTLGTDDPYAAGRLAMGLVQRGPDQAEAAFQWATEAMARGRGALEGPAYVELTDRMLAVRALSATSTWQLAELAFAAEGVGDPDGSRRRAEASAVEWLDYTRAAGTDDTLAESLCRASSLDPDRCG
jgi:hypothetical protein